MKVIVGLGNPGQAYARTRHNVGWMVIDRLAQPRHVVVSKQLRRFLHVVAVYGDYHEGTQTVRLVKPQTMMNRSGEALKTLQPDMAVSDLLLVCDDVNLPLGRLRFRAQGSAGGHRGLASSLQALQTEQVARLRVGIGGGRAGEDLIRVVLATFTSEEQSVVEPMIQRAVEACEMWVKEGIEAAMNRYNTAQETS